MLIQRRTWADGGLCSTLICGLAAISQIEAVMLGRSGSILRTERGTRGLLSVVAFENIELDSALSIV